MSSRHTGYPRDMIYDDIEEITTAIEWFLPIMQRSHCWILGFNVEYVSPGKPFNEWPAQDKKDLGYTPRHKMNDILPTVLTIGHPCGLTIPISIKGLDKMAKPDLTDEEIREQGIADPSRPWEGNYDFPVIPASLQKLFDHKKIVWVGYDANQQIVAWRNVFDTHFLGEAKERGRAFDLKPLIEKLLKGEGGSDITIFAKTMGQQLSYAKFKGDCTLQRAADFLNDCPGFTESQSDSFAASKVERGRAYMQLQWKANTPAYKRLTQHMRRDVVSTLFLSLAGTLYGSHLMEGNNESYMALTQAWKEAMGHVATLPERNYGANDPEQPERKLERLRTQHVMGNVRQMAQNQGQKLIGNGYNVIGREFITHLTAHAAEDWLKILDTFDHNEDLYPPHLRDQLQQAIMQLYVQFIYPQENTKYTDTAKAKRMMDLKNLRAWQKQQTKNKQRAAMVQKIKARRAAGDQTSTSSTPMSQATSQSSASAPTSASRPKMASAVHQVAAAGSMHAQKRNRSHSKASRTSMDSQERKRVNIRKETVLYTQRYYQSYGHGDPDQTVERHGVSYPQPQSHYGQGSGSTLRRQGDKSASGGRSKSNVRSRIEAPRHGHSSGQGSSQQRRDDRSSSRHSKKGHRAPSYEDDGEDLIDPRHIPSMEFRSQSRGPRTERSGSRRRDYSPRKGSRSDHGSGHV